MARVPLDYVILMNGAVLQHEAEGQGLEWPSESRQSRLTRFRENVSLAPVTAHMEGGDINQLLDALEVVRTVADPPEECSNETCVVLQDLSFRICCDATWVEDPLASDNVAVHMDGDNSAWAIQVPFNTLLPPYGDWRIFVVMRAEPVGGASGTAISFGAWGAFGMKIDEIPVSQIADGQYHTFRVPSGPYQRDEEAYVWMVPEGGNVTDLYVDLVFAIQQ